MPQSAGADGEKESIRLPLVLFATARAETHQIGMILFTGLSVRSVSLFHRPKVFDIHNVKQLHEEHVKLAVLAGQLSRMIAPGAPPPAQQLYPIRMRLASELIRHLKSEDWILYPTLLASRRRDVALIARAFSASMGGLATEFKAYCDRWGADAITHNWTGYQSDTTKILRALTLRMNREERDLYPLLDLATQAAA